ncbi:hypothetical protein H310_01879 [Aphanomyces invadans]|uniref:Uncharacterized protein n=1 Tax=Aphanomyces invadans TaxID=157072 RepID=A0A024UMD6_9STRA|nr:hypothetical protein H310_01879 [Aphanomyces invadans]ETW07340.1 hypothetical protein H310_01879 [Aphanomyces invadans]|eukprot:XP_008863433.1 hypothetical protein H310_01879 [Aphanomyces invadans]
MSEDFRLSQFWYNEFVFYDYNASLDVEERLHGFFNYVLVEPPYLECMKGFGQTMNLISREVKTTPDGKQVMLTPNAFINC